LYGKDIEKLKIFDNCERGLLEQYFYFLEHPKEAKNIAGDQLVFGENLLTNLTQFVLKVPKNILRQN
jgi:hypothetical protein